MKQVTLLASLVVLALQAVLGCAHGTGGGQPSGTELSGRYVIGQSDELEVQVWQEPDLSRTAIVRGDGMLSLPLVNDVKAEGLTVAELRELLCEKYGELVADPVVSVMVVKPLSATFFITGKVQKPGEYPLQKQTTLLQAVATAGGFTEWAKKGSLSVIRRSGERVRVDYDDIVDGDMGQNLKLGCGDTVVVP